LTWSPFFTALLGATFGGGATTAVNVVKARMDLTSSLCDQIISKIHATADLSSEYWLIDPANAALIAMSAPS